MVDAKSEIHALAMSAEVKVGSSRLDPHYEDIRELRRRGWSYRDIQAALAEKGVVCCLSCLHGFLRRRMRQGGISMLFPDNGVLDDAANVGAEKKFDLSF